jgi:hypothetical protein
VLTTDTADAAAKRCFFHLGTSRPLKSQMPLMTHWTPCLMAAAAMPAPSIAPPVASLKFAISSKPSQKEADAASIGSETKSLLNILSIGGRTPGGKHSSRPAVFVHQTRQ